jgi:aspartyl protease family protein
MARIAVWAVAIMFAIAFALRLVPAAAPPATDVAPAPSAPVAEAAGNGIAEAAIARADDGHFYADALVNGTPVRFLVDTGATTVALTREDAQRAGLSFANADFDETARGAGGAIATKSVTLDRVAVGPVEASAVEAVVAESKLAHSLLGQSFLSRVRTVTIAGDRMVLR